MMDMMDISHDEDDDYDDDDDKMRWAILFSSYGSLFATHKMRGVLSWKRASMFYFSFIPLFLITKLDIFGRAHFWFPTLLIKHAGPCSLDRGFLNPSVLQVVDVCCCCHWQDQKNDTPENAGCCWEREKRLFVPFLIAVPHVACFIALRYAIRGVRSWTGRVGGLGAERAGRAQTIRWSRWVRR